MSRAWSHCVLPLLALSCATTPRAPELAEEKLNITDGCRDGDSTACRLQVSRILKASPETFSVEEVQSVERAVWLACGRGIAKACSDLALLYLGTERSSVGATDERRRKSATESFQRGCNLDQTICALASKKGISVARVEIVPEFSPPVLVAAEPAPIEPCSPEAMEQLQELISKSSSRADQCMATAHAQIQRALGTTCRGEGPTVGGAISAALLGLAGKPVDDLGSIHRREEGIADCRWQAQQEERKGAMAVDMCRSQFEREQSQYRQTAETCVSVLQAKASARRASAPAPVSTSSVKLVAYGGPSHDVFVGCLTCATSDRDSVFNAGGAFGNRFGPQSLLNPNGVFGSSTSDLSACNPSAVQVPVVFDEVGNSLGNLTLNDSRNQTRVEGVIEWLRAVCGGR